ncbi:MAG: zf-TFIIB domain-containing protein [Acidimicrobiales bacterium]
MCPKCQAVMRTVNRDGMHIEQCTSCRGIFLDAGELEQMIAAEQAYNEVPAYEPPGAVGSTGPTVPGPYRPPGAVPPASPAPPVSPQPPRRRYEDSPRPYQGYRDSPPPHRGYRDSPPPYGSRKRRKSFLETLFD